MLGYNQTFHVNFDTSADKFQNYYKDLSQRVKAREVDLLIVVNMFLTGFDATTLNTLWVDKNLKMHGLIQAFSRTNRILNSVKTYGNIVCFRNLQKATDDAIALFGDREASGVVLLKGYDAYYDGYEENGKAVPGYCDLIDELSGEFPLGQPITGEQQQKQQELEQIIAEEKLKPAEAQRFVANAFRDGALKTTGTDIDQILPPVSRFGGGNRTEKEKTIIQRLAQFFEKYFGI